MTDRVRPYLYYDIAISICSTCYRKVEGKIVFESGAVFLLKRCPEHGAERVLIADDVDYYRRSREVFIKPPEMPYRYNTPVKWGCPYDCGLCSDHEQHCAFSEKELRAHRPPRRAIDPVRHLQSVLSRRPGANAPHGAASQGRRRKR